MRVEVPGIDPDELHATLAEGRIMLDVLGGPGGTASTLASHLRRYSFVLPRECDPASLAAEPSHHGFWIVGRKRRAHAIDRRSSAGGLSSLGDRWSAT
jgi:hypothetical protein